MKRKILIAALLSIMTAVLLAVCASADIGPKPSVQITFDTSFDDECWGTLLSLNDSTGPATTYEKYKNASYSEEDAEYDIWRAFVDYDDRDGYYFLQEMWRISDDGKLNWTYYPPSPFKILIYYPGSGEFAVSGVYERYAFDSYFAAHFNPSDGTVTAVTSYDFTWETVSFVCRAVFSILIEILAAYLFGYREKKLVLFILATNVITQLGLNIALNVVNYRSGYVAFMFWYIVLEAAVFVLEAVMYALAFPKLSEKTQSTAKAVLYSLSANLISFITGYITAKLVPGIF